MREGEIAAFGSASPVAGPAYAVRAEGAVGLTPVPVPNYVAPQLGHSHVGQSPQAWLPFPKATGDQQCAYPSPGLVGTPAQQQILGQAQSRASSGGQSHVQWGQALGMGALGAVGPAQDEFNFPRGGVY